MLTGQTKNLSAVAHMGKYISGLDEVFVKPLVMFNS